MIIRSSLVACLLAVFLAGSGAHAQPQQIVTDRPDITESSGVVGFGMAQIETSVQWETFDLGGTDTESTYLPTLIRFGVHRQLEVRLATEAYSTLDVDGSSNSGWAPLEIGAKLNFFENDAGQSAALIVHVGLPSGTDVFENDDTPVGVIAAFDMPFGDRLGFGTNAGFDVFEGTDGESLVGGVLTGVVGYEAAEPLVIFIEAAAGGMGLTPEYHQVIFDGGAAYHVNSDLQLDLAIGAGVMDETGPDFFFTFGVSFRTPVLNRP